MVITKTTANPNGKTQKVAFIPAFLEDNPVGMARDPGYIERLLARGDQTAQALRYGRWDVFSGQLFTTFVKGWHTCQVFEIPASWTRWRAVDWGFAAPFCCLWFAKNPDTKRIYVYRELYEVGLHDPTQAEKIKEFSGEEKFTFTFADPSMWTKRTVEIVAKSTYDAYLAGGVFLTKAENSQQQKISKTRSALANIHDEKPAVVIFETCTNLIRTLPALMSKPGQPEEMLENQEDHAWDAFAYGLTAWIPPQPPEEKSGKKKTSGNPWTKVKGL